MAETVLWIGLGNIGRGMCKNLVEKANLSSPLLIYNRTVARATDLKSSLTPGKIEIVESIEDGVSRADIIFTCLANDQAVRETYSKIAGEDVNAKVFIECSTIAPETTAEVARTVIEKRAEFVCAPVFGAPAAVEAGKGIFVLAGPKDSVSKVKQYTSVIGGGEIDMSDEPYEKGSTLKVLGNTIIMGMVEQLAQTYTVAEKSGLGTDYIRQFVTAIFPGTPYVGYSDRMLSGDYYKRKEPLFAVDLARKDAGHAIAIAKAVGARLRGSEIADKHLQAVREHAGPSGDMAGMYGAARQEAGLRYENDA